MKIRGDMALLALGAGPLQLAAILVAKRMGLRVIVLDADAGAPGLSLGDAGYVVNIANFEACLTIARREQVKGVVHICSEVSMAVMGRLNEALKLHGIDHATAVRATNKIEMRRAFAAGGAPSPKSIGAATESEAVAAGEVIGRPLIVKPSRIVAAEV